MRPEPRQRGVSLAELLVTQSVLALTAAIALPALKKDDSADGLRALRQIEAAVRYARTRAQVSGQRYGVTFDEADQIVRVFRLDTEQNMVFDVRDPITRQPYTLAFGRGALGRVTNVRIDVQWDSTCGRANTIAFDPAGFVRCVSPLTAQARNIQASLVVERKLYRFGIHGVTGQFTR